MRTGRIGKASEAANSKFGQRCFLGRILTQSLTADINRVALYQEQSKLEAMDAAALERLAPPGVTALVAFLAYSSQWLFYHVEPGPLRNGDAYLFNALVASLLICYWRTCFTDPGRIPRDWWEKSSAVGGEDGEDEQKPQRQRWCRKCETFKPPRAHHCKTCKRYDIAHHMPIGHRNKVIADQRSAV